MDFKQLLEIMAATLGQGIIVTDAMARVVFFYEISNSIGGIEPENAVGKSIFEIFPSLTPETSTFSYVLKTGKPLLEYVQYYCNFKGKKVCTVTSTIPIIANGVITGAFEIYRDFNQVKNLTKKVSSYSSIHASDSVIENGTIYTFEDIVGESEIMYELKEKAFKVADSDSPIFLFGETGTGKELFVQAIHNAGYRKNEKFVSQNCAALPNSLFESIFFGTASGSFTGAKESPGLFEQSNGGTLFLDEINSMDFINQGKLLRVLQDGVVRRVGGIKTISVDSRIMASINEDPIELIEKKELRKDLYYRLNVIGLTIPPLRKRKEDIPLLVNYFLKKFNEKMNKQVMGVSPKVMDKLIAYNWPGNVRELKHTIERAISFSDENILEVIILPDEELKIKKEIEIRGIGYIEEKKNHKPLNYAIEEFEKELIEKAIRDCFGNYSKAARLLEVPRQTLYNKIKKYDINLDSF